MTTSRRIPIARILSLTIIVAMTGCGAGSSSQDAAETAIATSSTASRTTDEGVYIAYMEEDYLLRESATAGAGELPLGLEPSIHWYAQYSSGPPSFDKWVRVSGHLISAAMLSKQPGIPADRQERQAGDWKVLAAASSPDDPHGASTVLIEIEEDYTILVLSYELDIDSLVEWTSNTSLVTKVEWSEATAPS